MSSALVSFSGGILRINGLNASSQTLTTGTSGTDFNISSTSSTHTFNIPTASSTKRGLLSSTDWSTFNGKQNAITLTTTGSSGASTFISNTLNIPTYTLSGLGGVPTSRTLTINGVAQDLSADRSWTIASVVNWSETFSSATQATSQWTPLNAATNVNAAITPKGTGALVAQIPTGTIVGGNARGTYSVDFQMDRNNANQVASGNYSAIVSGVNCRVSGNLGFSGAGASSVISGNNSAVIVGTSNTVSGNSSSIVSGQSNTVSSNDSFLGGGNSHTISAQFGTIGGGQSNTVSTNTHGFIGGGLSNTVSGQYGSTAGGAQNTNSSQYGVVVGGRQNSVNGGTYDLVVGGYLNTIVFAAVGNNQGRLIVGGTNNTIDFGGNEHTCIVGGSSNFIGVLANYAFLGGGRNNSCTGLDSTLTGGRANRIGNGSYATATVCFLGGGQSNVIDTNSDYSTLVGGLSNTISGVDYAFIGGGNGNQAAGAYSVSVGGFQNLATALSSTIGGGDRNTASGVNSVISGGGDHLATAQYSTVSGGWANKASALYATVKGGALAEASLYGQQAFAAGRFGGSGVYGDAQAHELIWRRLITGTAQTELFLDGASIAAILPATNTIWHGTIDIASICTVVGNGTTTLGDVTATSYKVTIKRIGTATTLVGTVQEIGTTNQDNAIGSTFLIDNNNTNESLRIQCTPPTSAGSTTVHRVVATFRGLQIQY